MKNILTLGALALTLAVLSNQQATAWTNCRFGIGMNVSRQAGGNNFAWGLFRNGQPPCAADCGCMPSPCPTPYGGCFQQGPMDQGPGGVYPPNPAAGNLPAQPQSYNRPNFTVNYRYPYSYPYNYNYNYNNAYNYNYGSNYGYNYYNNGYNR